MTRYNLDEIVARVLDTGNYFFTEESMKWWKSRTLGDFAYDTGDGFAFATSESDWRGGRKYCLRIVTFEQYDDGDGIIREKCHIETVSSAYRDARQARNAAKSMGV